MSLSKLVDSIRIYDSMETKIHKAWIPLVGTIVFFVFAVTYWVKISSTTKQIQGLRESTVIPN